MFVILISVVYRATGEIPAFQGPWRLLIAFCVSAPVVWGFDQAIVAFIVHKDDAMTVAILVSVASLILAAWMSLAKQSHSGPRR